MKRQGIFGAVLGLVGCFCLLVWTGYMTLPARSSADMAGSDLTADFQVTDIEIAFTNGKYYRVVPLKSMSPPYRVTVKSRGQGILRGKWLLDDVPAGLFAWVLKDKNLLVVDQSQGIRLPVSDVGMHRFSLEFTNYTPQIKIPFLRYFVTVGGAIDLVFPPVGGKISDQMGVELEWAASGKDVRYDLAVSAVPFQFLRDNQLAWQDVGEVSHFLLNLSPYKKGDWIYWQVRQRNVSGEVATTSEISFFKVTDRLP